MKRAIFRGFAATVPVAALMLAIGAGQASAAQAQPVMASTAHHVTSTAAHRQHGATTQDACDSGCTTAPSGSGSGSGSACNSGCTTTPSGSGSGSACDSGCSSTVGTGSGAVVVGVGAGLGIGVDLGIGVGIGAGVGVAVIPGTVIAIPCPS